jgi:hypothetical protein
MVSSLLDRTRGFSDIGTGNFKGQLLSRAPASGTARHGETAAGVPGPPPHPIYVSGLTREVGRMLVGIAAAGVGAVRLSERHLRHRLASCPKREEAAMHAIVAVARIEPGRTDEGKQHLESTVVPRVKQAPRGHRGLLDAVERRRARHRHGRLRERGGCASGRRCHSEHEARLRHLRQHRGPGGRRALLARSLPAEAPR